MAPALMSIMGSHGRPPHEAAAEAGRKADATALGKTAKYKLLVTAGASYDESTHQVVTVNSSDATLIDGPHMAVKLHVRVRDYRGLPSRSPTHSPYFEHPLHRKDQYSVAFSFVPKKRISSQHLVWGNDFDHPIRDRLPPGFHTAYRIAQILDPGIECDAYSDQPWSYGPALSCWFTFRIGDRHDPGGRVQEPGGNMAVTERASPARTIADRAVIEEGADGSGLEVREQLGIPDSAHKRRKHFLSPSHRAAFDFEPGRVYHADFFNPYLDLNRIALRLPGIKIRIWKYIDDKTHTLRYVFKDREKGETYLVVVFKLLFGDRLAAAMEQKDLWES